MSRATFVALLLGIGAAATAPAPPAAWPFRALVSDPRGRPVAFQAVSLGGMLIVTAGERSNPNRPLDPPVAVLRPLARGDTLRATTPADYPLDLARGAVVFFTLGRDSVRLVVGRNPFGAIAPVTAQGRRLTVRLVNDSVVIDAR